MTTVTTQLPNDEYAEARREWRDRYADLARGKRNWQFAALGFFGLAVLTSTIALIQVRQVKRIPYLVQADPTGAIVTTIPQLSPSSAVIPLNRIEIVTVAEFIREARSVLADTASMYAFNLIECRITADAAFRRNIEKIEARITNAATVTAPAA